MMPKDINRRAAAAHGFTLVELMVTFAVIGVLLGVAVPNVQTWRRNYNVKSAVTDLYANMQLTRLGAIRSNQPWTMAFLLDGSYEVRDDNYPRTNKPLKQIVLQDKYHGNIVYGAPPTTSPSIPPCDNANTTIITFHPGGTADRGDGVTAPGCVYLAGNNQSVYYRVGIQLTGSAARIQRWHGGSTWR